MSQFGRDNCGDRVHQPGKSVQPMARLEIGIFESATTGGGILNTRGSTEQRFIIESAHTQDRGYYPPNQRVENPRGGNIRGRHKLGYLPLISKSCLMVLGRYSGHAHAHGT